MQILKHPYETTFIVNASLEDPQIETVITRVQEAITKGGGDINAVNRWGRKRMMYAIKKKNNGFYTNIEMMAPATLAKELERFYLLEESILRFLTIRVDKRALKAREMAIARASEESRQAEPVPPGTEAPLFDDKDA